MTGVCVSGGVILGVDPHSLCRNSGLQVFQCLWWVAQGLVPGHLVTQICWSLQWGWELAVADLLVLHLCTFVIGCSVYLCSLCGMA